MAGRDEATNQLENFRKSNQVQGVQVVNESHDSNLNTKQNKSLARLTTSAGAPIGNKAASLTVGPRGPILLQDHVLIDEIAHFDRERIPERAVHAKGAGTISI